VRVVIECAGQGTEYQTYRHQHRVPGKLLFPGTRDGLRLTPPPGPPGWYGHPEHSSLEPGWGRFNGQSRSNVNVRNRVAHPSSIPSKQKCWLRSRSPWKSSATSNLARRFEQRCSWVLRLASHGQQTHDKIIGAWSQRLSKAPRNQRRAHSGGRLVSGHRGVLIYPFDDHEL
jgi:hypothetical protein